MAALVQAYVEAGDSARRSAISTACWPGIPANLPARLLQAGLDALGGDAAGGRGAATAR